MDPFSTFEHAGLTIELHYDDQPESPREWDHLSVICAWHRRSDLGDEGFNYRDLPMDGDTPELGTVKDWLVAQGAKHLIPLYIYEHSGQTIKASKGGNPFGCPWDSGQVGFVFTTDEKIREVDPNLLQMPNTAGPVIEQMLIQEVRTYDAFLRGEVYGYIIKDSEGESLGGCWGFVGELEYCKSMAKDEADGLAEGIVKEKNEAAHWAARDTVTV